MLEAMAFKIPESVLVVVHTPALEILLLERAGKGKINRCYLGEKKKDYP